MKLSKLQEKRLENIVAKMKDNMIDNLISEGFVDIAYDILGKKRMNHKAFQEVAEEVLGRLFK